MKKILAIMVLTSVSVKSFSQDINFSSEYNRVSWPVSLSVGGGITGDDGSYKRLALYHGGSISLQTGSNSPGIANSRLFIDGLGNVGIGTTSPGAKLDVGAFIPNGALGTVFGRLPEGNSSWGGTFLGVRGYDTQPVNSKSFAIEHSFYGLVNSSINFTRGLGTTGGFITLNTYDNTERMRIDAAGNVGIGTTDPKSFKLAVNGKIWGTEVQVALTNPGPDYVFEPTYTLPTLESVKTYIDENKHLPEIPSAKEMEKNGVQLGEMNMLLLKKIEELTLYVIELNQKMDEMKKKDDAQQKEIEQLRTRK